MSDAHFLILALLIAAVAFVLLPWSLDRLSLPRRALFTAGALIAFLAILIFPNAHHEPPTVLELWLVLAAYAATYCSMFLVRPRADVAALFFPWLALILALAIIPSILNLDAARWLWPIALAALVAAVDAILCRRVPPPDESNRKPHRPRPPFSPNRMLIKVVLLCLTPPIAILASHALLDAAPPTLRHDTDALIRLLFTIHAPAIILAFALHRCLYVRILLFVLLVAITIPVLISLLFSTMTW